LYKIKDDFDIRAGIHKSRGKPGVNRRWGGSDARYMSLNPDPPIKESLRARYTKLSPPVDICKSKFDIENIIKSTALNL
jgi:hypothetical protein